MCVVCDLTVAFQRLKTAAIEFMSAIVDKLMPKQLEVFNRVNGNETL
jgi:hypothetical protein